MVIVCVAIIGVWGRSLVKPITLTWQYANQDLDWSSSSPERIDAFAYFLIHNGTVALYDEVRTTSFVTDSSFVDGWTLTVDHASWLQWVGLILPRFDEPVLGKVDAIIVPLWLALTVTASVVLAMAAAHHHLRKHPECARILFAANPARGWRKHLRRTVTIAPLVVCAAIASISLLLLMMSYLRPDHVRFVPGPTWLVVQGCRESITSDHPIGFGFEWTTYEIENTDDGMPEYTIDYNVFAKSGWLSVNRLAPTAIEVPSFIPVCRTFLFAYTPRTVTGRCFAYPSQNLGISLWFLLALFAAPPLISIAFGPLHRWRRFRRGCCMSCGYNLYGTVSETCSECGVAVPAREAES